MESTSHCVRPGGDPMPFFQEIAAVAWGERAFDSEGDCRWPTDREWTELWVRPRAGAGACLSIAPRDDAAGELQIVKEHDQDGRLAAALIAIRTPGNVIDLFGRTVAVPELVLGIDDFDQRMARADEIQRALQAPDFRPWWPASLWPHGFAD